MLSTELLEKKKHLDKILNNTKNDFDLFNILRTECDRIDFVDKEIILNFEKTKFNIDRKTNKNEHNIGREVWFYGTSNF